MELKEFIKETLVQIVKGIKEANDSLDSFDSFVASSNCFTPTGNVPLKGSKGQNGKVHLISDDDFDLAISVKNVESKQGGGNVQLLSVLNFGGKVDNKSQSDVQNRIKFTIPLALPLEIQKDI